MNKNTLNISLILIFVLAFIGFNSLYVVTEGTKGIVTRFGKVVRDSEGKLQIVDPGLHLKAPFIDQVKALDVKIQTISSSADRFVTSEKKDVIIDSYVKWQILDAATYYLTTAGGNKMQAEELLRRRINNSLRSQIGRLTIHQIVSGQNSGKNQATEEENVFDSSDSEVVAVASQSKRDEVMQNALKDIGASAKALGIKIVDVRIKQINLPPEVSNSIYQRMRAERDAVAKLHRSQGRKEAEAIKAHADREVVVKIAEAERQARTLRGEGDAEATRIYAQAYKQNPQLFEFLRSMDAYKKSMASGKDVLVLKPDSEFFKYFNDANGAKGTN
ncbi:MAG: protease modulator HflC [Succinivibrio dextrinosolvens]|uniref:Protein HflC n=1 Tax=Succinivibrio dextrinosolvens TaxID=83771 RepID=A0A662ZB77_9GAMM|nr:MULTISPECIES: protease modulator HflC [Succinivibrio]MBQ9221840.1 protease modulator HflC [Succinivibrio sp.]MDY6416218.1 protease modulator HflC [Succinivibrio dextrinosolvens]MDY6420807.1 protease modulator HflC [Succinivibrio dextrinosolvens]MDY6469703.1 protease modulator HflC [Succinivibrio dextrinosolvens]SFK30034.1 protease FtsH subunit HflC [Succinivibrio dextrinosolvens]